MPSVARAWAYVSSVFQFGGVSSLLVSGQHAPSNAYTLRLQLALGAGAWDGDAAEADQHCFLKCFFFSVYAALLSADAAPDGRGTAQANAANATCDSCIS